MRRLLTSMTLLFLIILSEKTTVSARRNKGTLIEDLLADYEKSVRPVKNENNDISVTVDIAIRHVLELDMKTEILKSLVFCTLLWRDEFLRWNSSQYGGLEVISLSADKIWVPDLTLYNNVGSEHPFRFGNQSLIVNHDGNITYICQPKITETVCNVDIQNYPVDTQVCSFYLGSGIYNDNQVHLIPYASEMEQDVFHTKGEWLLQDTVMYLTPRTDVSLQSRKSG
ncbi:neuronal acetylcholine receptor subunit alpha-5-like [Glandiceps talaboti]